MKIDIDADDEKRLKKAADLLALQALAQPAVEPLFWYRPCNDGLYEGPVHAKSIDGKRLRDEKPDEWKALYTRPQPAAWVGLTDEDINALIEQARKVPEYSPCPDYNTRLLTLANAKLREKNGGAA